MCLACIEIAKANMKPADFVRNVTELINTIDDEAHTEVLSNVLNSLPEEYQKQIEDYVKEEKNGT